MGSTSWPEVQSRARAPGSVVLTKFKAEQEAKRAAASVSKRAFSAARVDRLTSSWMATTASINQELRSDLDRLRARSRDLTKNNDYARKFRKLVVSNVVGPNGFNLQARVTDGPGKPDGLANAALESAFWQWAKRGVCDVTGKLGFADFCRAVMGGMAPDGEYLVRKVYGAKAGNKFGFALQHLDVDKIVTTMNREAGRGINAIRMGVEVNEFGRPLAYHVYQSHPSDTGSGRNIERIPADEIMHDFIAEFPEQVRGVPWMSAAILTMHHLGEFESSALLAARKGADTLGFFVSPNGEPPTMGDTGSENEPIAVSVPGMYDTLPEGYDFKAYDSRYPDAMLADFTKAFLRRMSAGLNVSYNGLANDLEGVNFSSIRAGVLDERDQWMTVQGWFIESFMTPVYESWLRAALASGMVTMPNGSALPTSKLDKFSAHTWQGRRWSWVDPMKDIESSLLAIRSGLNTPQAVAAQMGLDLEDVIASLANANAMATAAGLPAYCAPGLGIQPSSPEPSSPLP